MKKTRVGKPYGGPWFNQYGVRRTFERDVEQYFPDLEGKIIKEKLELYLEYKLIIEVPPSYESRCVAIRFSNNIKKLPVVTVDGPNDSPHRYNEGELCMWYPYDPKVNRWVQHDGLLHLLIIIQKHLFREAWWRETGEWLGKEVAHN